MKIKNSFQTCLSEPLLKAKNREIKESENLKSSKRKKTDLLQRSKTDN